MVNNVFVVVLNTKTLNIDIYDFINLSFKQIVLGIHCSVQYSGLVNKIC